MSRTEDQAADRPAPKRRKGLPSPSTVISETTITSPKGRVYRVIRTTQKDQYDEPAEKAEEKPKEAEKPARRKGKRRKT